MPPKNYNHLTASLPGQPGYGVSQYQQGKPILDFNEARDGVFGWQWHRLDHMQTICTSLQTDKHANISSLHYIRAGYSSDINSVKVKVQKTTINPTNKMNNNVAWLQGIYLYSTFTKGGSVAERLEC